MQPYIFPYIGYFQLMSSSDEFVVYDNIEFTKKGWINRNRILVNGRDEYISFPLKKDSDFLQIRQRFLADSWGNERGKLLNKIIEAYRRAPNFKFVFPIIETTMLFQDSNLFAFIFNSLTILKTYFGIQTPLTISSSIKIDHTLKAEKKVIEICKERKASMYINSIGGVGLYSKEEFRSEGIELTFIKTNSYVYKQLDNEFVPWLSIIDVMMFNSLDKIKEILIEGYSLV